MSGRTSLPKPLAPQPTDAKVAIVRTNVETVAKVTKTVEIVVRIFLLLLDQDLLGALLDDRELDPSI